MLSRIEAKFKRVNQYMAVIAAVVLAGMMLLTVGDVIGRYFFNRPITGTYELVGLLLVCAGTWGLGYCQIEKAHISITILLDRFPKRARAIFNSFTYLIGLAGFSLVSWRMFVLATQYTLQTKGNVTDTLGIYYSPFMYILAISTGIIALVLITDLIHSIAEAVRR